MESKNVFHLEQEELDLTVEPQFFTRDFSAQVLDKLFKLRELWFLRSNRGQKFREPNWYTLGSALYLDLKGQDEVPSYFELVEYGNAILKTEFDLLLKTLLVKLEPIVGPCEYLQSKFYFAGLPGFHIFKGEKTHEFFFGNWHKDRQGHVLFYLPDFPFMIEEVTKVQTFTIPLKMPYIASGLQVGGRQGQVIRYDENTLYAHSGLCLHAISAFAKPVLEGDWRITIQFHSIEVYGVTYLYW